ncbi:lipase member K-like [Pararge aegeria]|nr:lipase member K-like [Pararge aegeria]
MSANARLTFWTCSTALFAAIAVGLYSSGTSEAGRLASGPAENNFTAVAARHGYRSEQHTVATADGFLLTVFRIRRGQRCAGSVARAPVLLLSGLLLSAESWLAAGPAAGLAFLLPDACHDTWLGNARGGAHARRHRRLRPRDPAFWQFSADEVGAYDAPATVDYILNHTGRDKLNFIGYSQGGTAAFIMLAERPEYANKLGVLLAIAPPTDLIHMTSAFGWFLKASEMLEGTLARIGVYEVFATGSVIQRIAEHICRFRIIRDSLCRGFFEMLDSPHPGSIADETYETLYSHFPSGTSVRSMAWYGQTFRSGKFRKYDFGERGNQKKYGSPHPPEYELGSVAVPTVILQGQNDQFVTVRDSERLASRLPHAELCIIEDPLWNHIDVLFSQNINGSLFPKINQYLLKYNTR